MLGIKYDGAIDIAIGKNRHEKNWKNRQWEWSDLLDRISDTHRTTETYKEYLNATKDRQAEIKDIGGYVGGHMSQGRRKTGSVTYRQLITLDIDYGNLDFWEDFCLKLPYAAAIHTTHKHCDETPKYRLVMPLDRTVGGEEYAAISRKIAGLLGIEMFDTTTFQDERLMYWPSTSSNGKWFFAYQDEEWISADAVLDMYEDWTDTSEWPMSVRAKAAVKRGIAKQGEPTEKKGIVGSFCRTYTLSEAIEKFLPDVYERCDVDDRYSFIGGSTSAGLVVYEDKFAYSHHGTDPISGKLVNAFDLIRLHRFGPMDDDTSEDTPINRHPSYLEMSDFAMKDDEVRKLVGTERFNQALQEFSVYTDVDTLNLDDEESVEWLKEMEIDDKDKYKSTINNVLIALECDPNLKGKLGFNQFDRRELAYSNLPWRQVKTDSKNLTDTDDAGLRHYMERVYGISNNGKIKDALDISVYNHGFHPIKDYFKTLVWDGEDRISTFLVDYMGVTDSAYIRAITRKTLVAAVARIYEPGIKFDFVLTLVGKQGVGKSQLFSRLGQQWFSDSFSGVQGKESFEQLQGVWIVEIAELAGLKKADADAVKHFVGKTIDRYRVAYGKRVDDFPRQCIFVASTNDHYFLVAVNGNRRFWPATVYEHEPTKSVFTHLTPSEVGQIWAQALVIYAEGEDLFLSQELEEQAFGIQDEHTIFDDRIGIIEKYLDTLLPENWEELDIYERRAFLQGDDPLTPPGTVQRTRVCIGELWCEALEGRIKDITNYNTKSLHEIMSKLSGWEKYKSKFKNKTYGVQRGYSRVSAFDHGKLI